MPANAVGTVLTDALPAKGFTSGITESQALYKVGSANQTASLISLVGSASAPDSGVWTQPSMIKPQNLIELGVKASLSLCPD